MSRDPARTLVPDAGGNDVGGIAFAAFEIATAEMTTIFLCPITASTAERGRISRLRKLKTPRF